jgi:hypothetical protein
MSDSPEIYEVTQLRQQLAEVTQERNELFRSVDTAARGIVRLQHEIDTLTLRLAEAQAKIEQIQSEMASEYECDMNEQLRKNRELTHQLSQAINRKGCTMKSPTFKDIPMVGKDGTRNNITQLLELTQAFMAPGVQVTMLIGHDNHCPCFDGVKSLQHCQCDKVDVTFDTI